MPIRVIVGSEFARLRDALSRAPEHVARELDRATGGVALDIADAIRARAPKASSQLTNSTRPERDGVLAWKVRSNTQYAWYVEHGRPPGRYPDFVALSDWVRTKLHVYDFRARRDVTWAVARKIRRDGIAPQPFFRPVAEDPAWTDRLNDRARQAVTDGLRSAGVR